MAVARRGERLMSTLEVVAVSQHPADAAHADAYLDLPLAGTRLEAAALTVQGWVVGQAAAAAYVEILAGGMVRGRFLVKELRADVASHFPDRPWAGRSGFRGTVDLVGSRGSELVVQAVFPGGRRMDVATVSVRQTWLEPRPAAERDLVSIVIPCFNQAHFLNEAIESAFAQTHPRVEVIVIDDGSTDNTGEVASRYDRVRFAYQPNRGLAAARNAGLMRSTGEFVVFLDADDRLCCDAVAVNVTHLRQHPDSAFVYGAFRLLDRDGVPRDDQVRGGAVAGDAYASLLRRNHIGMHATVMYRREVFQTVRGFNEALAACEDYDLFLRIGRLFPVAGHKMLVAEYRQHGASMSSDSLKMLRTSLAVLRTQRPYVRHDVSLRDAYREGLRFLRTYYGEQVLAGAETAGRPFGRRRAIRSVLGVARHAPGVLAAAVQAFLLRRPSR